MKGAPIAESDPLEQVRKRIQIKWRGDWWCPTAGGVDQKAFRAEKHSWPEPQTMRRARPTQSNENR